MMKIAKNFYEKVLELEKEKSTFWSIYEKKRGFITGELIAFKGLNPGFESRKIEELAATYDLLIEGKVDVALAPPPPAIANTTVAPSSGGNNGVREARSKSNNRGKKTLKKRNKPNRESKKNNKKNRKAKKTKGSRNRR